jgi:ADP-ribose pyrophosphatase YjhB (NUDIX family)
VDRRVTSQDLVRWSEALAGIARTGLGFTENQYERERFEEVLAVAADIRHAAEIDALEPEELIAEWMKLVGEGVAGYQTPKIAVGAVVGNDHGEILLVQRSDSGIWLYPTGWADIGYSASEVAVKEVREETGIDCEVVRLIAVLDGLRLGFTRIPLYSLVFHCRALGGNLEAHPLECMDVGWFAQAAMPDVVAGADHWGDHAFQAIRGEHVDVLYDQPRKPPWNAND